MKNSIIFFVVAMVIFVVIYFVFFKKKAESNFEIETYSAERNLAALSGQGNYGTLFNPAPLPKLK
jgi:uncharacterized protein (UPF0333 family)